MPRQAYVAAYDDSPLKLGLGWMLNSLMTTAAPQGYTATTKP